MKSILKKVAVISMLSASAMAIQPSQSHAILGVATGNVALDAMGLLLMAGGAAANAHGNRNAARGSVIFGIFLLDDQTQMPSEFGPMTEELAPTFGLDPSTPTDQSLIAHYNESLPKIRQIHERIVFDAKNNPTLKTDQDIQSFARTQWQQMGSEELSVDAWTVLQKIQNTQN